MWYVEYYHWIFTSNKHLGAMYIFLVLLPRILLTHQISFIEDVLTSFQWIPTPQFAPGIPPNKILFGKVFLDLVYYLLPHHHPKDFLFYFSRERIWIFDAVLLRTFSFKKKKSSHFHPQTFRPNKLFSHWDLMRFQKLGSTNHKTTNYIFILGQRDGFPSKRTNNKKIFSAIKLLNTLSL